LLFILRPEHSRPRPKAQGQGHGIPRPRNCALKPRPRINIPAGTIIAKMTYNASSGTLNPTLSLYLSEQIALIDACCSMSANSIQPHYCWCMKYISRCNVRVSLISLPVIIYPSALNVCHRHQRTRSRSSSQKDCSFVFLVSASIMQYAWRLDIDLFVVSLCV